jgi:hypothetical protein
MPTKRTLRTRPPFSEMSEVAERFFMDESTEQDERGWEHYVLKSGQYDGKHHTSAKELWGLYADAILQAFDQIHPGERPCYWHEHHAIDGDASESNGF